MARMKIDKGFYKEHLYGIAYFVKMVDMEKGEKYLSQLDKVCFLSSNYFEQKERPGS